MGPPGSGKTSCYRVLAKALSTLNARHRKRQPAAVDDVTESVNVGASSDQQSDCSPSLSLEVYRPA